MDDGYLGQIKMLGYQFSPRNYSYCMGGILPIAQFTALFSLIGTFFGGDGRSSFGLPDFRGRVPIGYGTGPGLTPNIMGMMSGNEVNYLSINNMPTHSHAATVSGISAQVVINANSGNGNQSTATGNYWASLSDGGRGSQNTYADSTNDVMAADAVEVNIKGGNVTLNNSGNNSAFNLVQPSTVVNFGICTEGMYPARN